MKEPYHILLNDWVICNVSYLRNKIYVHLVTGISFYPSKYFSHLGGVSTVSMYVHQFEIIFVSIGSSDWMTFLRQIFFFPDWVKFLADASRSHPDD
jgi:hypothetical protein